jgi:excinuclease ABC subunit B
VPGRGGRGVSGGVVGIGAHAAGGLDVAEMPRAQLADLIQQLNDQMMSAARDLQFEVAARLRDEIAELKKELRGMDAAGVGR